ncbi:MAG TPA: M56 family metallopeptidase [Chitinophagaceae bacterium]|nr:M56 family metallopeptidase [Chitinophagaceae bacterium]
MYLFGIPIVIGTNFLQALGWAVLNSLWQIAFLWVVFQVILSFGVQRPAAKSRMATLFLGLGFAWFMYTLVSHWIVDPDAIKRSLLTIGSFDGNAAWNQKLQMILPFASAAYLLLLIIPIAQFIRNYRFVRIIRANGLSKCHVDLRIFVQKFSGRMGIKNRVHIYISELITSPVTIGFLKPIILLPIVAITNLSQKQVEAVLLHELAHIRRFDYFINLIVNFIRTILYFNPFVKLFAKTIEREREKSCDEMVMQFEYDPHGYASALLLLEQTNFMKQTIAIAASGQKNDLRHRIEKILGVEKRKTPDFQRLGGLLAGLICIVGLNALFFFSSPVIKNNSMAFTTISNPFYRLVSDGKENISVEKPVMNEARTSQMAVTVKASPVAASAKTIKKKTEAVTPINTIPEENLVYTQPQTENGFTQVDARLRVEPRLKKYQEEQVKGTVEATKKVLEQGQWKEVEKNVADALTETEKANLKRQYYAELDKVNWKGLENKLRLSYNNINWDRVNTQLGVEISNIRLDSLANIYSISLDGLSKAENWMTENRCQSIPDTDLKLGEVKVQKEKVEKVLKTITALKERKIIHL